jgi:hypothetical protein
MNATRDTWNRARLKSAAEVVLELRDRQAMVNVRQQQQQQQQQLTHPCPPRLLSCVLPSPSPRPRWGAPLMVGLCVRWAVGCGHAESYQALLPGCDAAGRRRLALRCRLQASAAHVPAPLRAAAVLRLHVVRASPRSRFFKNMPYFFIMTHPRSRVSPTSPGGAHSTDMRGAPRCLLSLVWAHLCVDVVWWV